ncbi:H-NS family histone-like protein [Vibrio mediterranei]|uniref:H-NS family histone-like protein n=1 Tax=Vibrio mediterranei TaxID=689 RepID=UPI004069278A
MSLELTKTLLNIRSLRAFTSEIPLEKLEDMLSKLTTVVTERREHEEATLAEKKAHQDLINSYVEMMVTEGIDINDLVEAVGKTKMKSGRKGSTRAPRAPRYEYFTSQGERKTWTGQGRTPSVIQDGLDSGRTLDSFAIQQ